MKSEYTPPRFKEEGFHCPHCGVFAHQHWYEITLEEDSEKGKRSTGEVLSVSTCERCDNFALWIDGEIIYPVSGKAPFPLDDMPDEIKREFLEARGILDGSPRSATALLRLALERLISHLGEKDDIIDNIENLRNRGLDAKFQKALHSVRMIGEEAVEPGQIDPGDDEETALILFNLMNLIVDTLITQPRMVDEILEKLPVSKKKEEAPREASSTD
jgi:hypothetical protein